MYKFSLKSARINAGYSQKKAAELLGISNKTLCRWEKKKSFPDQPMIEKICSLYRLPYDMIDFTA